MLTTLAPFWLKFLRSRQLFSLLPHTVSSCDPNLHYHVHKNPLLVPIVRNECSRYSFCVSRNNNTIYSPVRLDVPKYLFLYIKFSDWTVVYRLDVDPFIHATCSLNRIYHDLLILITGFCNTLSKTNVTLWTPLFIIHTSKWYGK